MLVENGNGAKKSKADGMKCVLILSPIRDRTLVLRVRIHVADNHPFIKIEFLCELKITSSNSVRIFQEERKLKNKEIGT